MVDITLFELHLDGAEFTANAHGVVESDETEEKESDSSGAPLGLFAVLALVVLGITAAAVKKWGGSGEDATVDEADAIDYTGEGI
jgi:hypothetical protein